MKAAPREIVEGLVRKHEAYVRTLALRLAPEPARADDIAQEAFVVAFAKLETLDLSRDLRPWLAALVRNLCRQAWDDAVRTNRLRSEALREHLETLAEQPSPLYDEPAKEALRKCLEKLPDRSRTILNLHYTAGLRSDDIAQRVSTTALAVRRAMVRIRQQLKACIDRSGLWKGAEA